MILNYIAKYPMRLKRESMIPQHVLEEIRRRRVPSRTTLSDIRRILEARESGDWSAVHQSRLYRCYSGEYCELLAVMHAAYPLREET